MRFFSDNAAPACPAVMEAIVQANQLDSPYDGDDWSKRLDDSFCNLFETHVGVMWVSTGTAANCLALAAMCPPDAGVICHKEAHIQMDEAGAPEFFTAGARLMLAEGDGAKLTPDSVRAVIDPIRKDVHQVQPRVISITNATEYGLTYSPEEVQALGEVAREHKLMMHMDGARFANAVVDRDFSLADVTWRAGIDALSFGFVKNGGMNAEALIFFRPDLIDVAKRRRKRAGHLQSKGRYLAAQILAMLENDLWLDNARAANAGAALLAEAASDRLIVPVEANELFLRLSGEEAAKLREQGFDFYDWGDGAARLVTAWDQGADVVKPLAEALRSL